MWTKTDKTEILWIGFGGGDIILRCSTWTRLNVQEFWAHEEMGKQFQTEWTDLSKMVGKKILKHFQFKGFGILTILLSGTNTANLRIISHVLSPFQMLPSYPLQAPSSLFLGDLSGKTELLFSLWLSLVVGLSQGYVCKEGRDQNW